MERLELGQTLSDGALAARGGIAAMFGQED